MRRVILLLLAVCLSSCALVAGTQRPTLRGRELTKTEASTFLSKLRDKDSALRTFRALYKATLTGLGGESSLRKAVVFEKPSKLRVELFPTTSFYSLGLAVIGGKKSWFIDPTEKIARSGDKNDNFIRSTLKIPAGASELMSLVAGTVPTLLVDNLLSTDSGKVFYDEATNKYQIVEGDFYSFWSIDGATLLGERADFRSRFDDTLSLRVTQSKYTGSIPYSLPSEIKFWVPGEGISIDMSLTTASINDKLSDSLFEATVPEGFSVY